VVDRAVRDHDDPRRVGVVAPDQAPLGGVGHRHHDVGRSEEAEQDVPLPGRRIPEDGVQHDDRRNGQRVQDGQDVDAVGAAVDAVLVLDHHRVEAVEATYGGTRAVRETVDQMRHHVPVVPEHGIVDHPHDTERTRATAQVLDESRAERGQTALGRWTGAQHPDGSRTGVVRGFVAELCGLVGSARRHVRFS
jgi:hypothetical protein